MVNVSEDRLHKRELTPLLAQRDELRLLCRNPYGECQAPRTLPERRTAIDVVVKGFDFVINAIVAQAINCT